MDNWNTTWIHNWWGFCTDAKKGSRLGKELSTTIIIGEKQQIFLFVKNPDFGSPEKQSLTMKHMFLKAKQTHSQVIEYYLLWVE